MRQRASLTRSRSDATLPENPTHRYQEATMGNKHGGGSGNGDSGQSNSESDGAKGSGQHGGGGSSAPTGNPSDGAKPK